MNRGLNDTQYIDIPGPFLPYPPPEARATPVRDRGAERSFISAAKRLLLRRGQGFFAGTENIHVGGVCMLSGVGRVLAILPCAGLVGTAISGGLASNQSLRVPRDPPQGFATGSPLPGGRPWDGPK